MTVYPDDRKKNGSVSKKNGSVELIRSYQEKGHFKDLLKKMRSGDYLLLYEGEVYRYWPHPDGVAVLSGGKIIINNRERSFDCDSKLFCALPNGIAYTYDGQIFLDDKVLFSRKRLKDRDIVGIYAHPDGVAIKENMGDYRRIWLNSEDNIITDDARNTFIASSPLGLIIATLEGEMYCDSVKVNEENLGNWRLFKVVGSEIGLIKIYQLGAEIRAYLNSVLLYAGTYGYIKSHPNGVLVETQETFYLNNQLLTKFRQWNDFVAYRHGVLIADQNGLWVNGHKKIYKGRVADCKKHPKGILAYTGRSIVFVK